MLFTEVCGAPNVFSSRCWVYNPDSCVYGVHLLQRLDGVDYLLPGRVHDFQAALGLV